MEHDRLIELVAQRARDRMAGFDDLRPDLREVARTAAVDIPVPVLAKADRQHGNHAVDVLENMMRRQFGFGLDAGLPRDREVG